VGTKVWQPDEPIQVSAAGNNELVTGKGYACNSKVVCSVQAQDMDFYETWRNGVKTGEGYAADTLTYQWSCSAGSFEPGTETQPQATWIAPGTPQTGITVQVTVDDSNTAGRNDSPQTWPGGTVIAYEIACTEVQATYDVNVYWRYKDPTQTDVIWRINEQSWETYGNITDDPDWQYYAVADMMRPVQQYYLLKFTLGRWPRCDTAQTPRVSVEWTYGLSDLLEAEADGWVVSMWVPDFQCVKWDWYSMYISFTVGGRGVPRGHRLPVSIYEDIHQCCVYGAPLCPVEERDILRFHKACEWGQCGSEEAEVAHNVMWRVNDQITQGCICPDGPWSTEWDDNVWDNAIPGSASQGMCDCRAHGMMLALQVLGTPMYYRVYVNEFPEPGEKGFYPGELVWCDGCEEWVARAAWHANGWNNFEGGCQKAEGQVCYAPAGRYEGTYAEICQAYGPWRWAYRNEEGQTYASEDAYCHYVNDPGHIWWPYP